MKKAPYHRAVPIALAMILTLILSCVSGRRYPAPSDPTSILSRDALAYVSLARDPLREFGPGLLPVAEATSLLPLLERTDRLAIAILPAATATATVAGTAASEPRIEAVLVGAYPWRSASFALGKDKSWKKSADGRAWFSASRAVGIAFPGPSLILAATTGREGAGSESIDLLLDRLASPAPSALPSALPPALAALGDRDILLWIPEPFVHLGKALLGEALDIPVQGVLVAASRAGSGTSTKPAAQGTPSGEEAVYETVIVFLMGSADDARVFRPAVRLAWYGLSKALFPGEEAVSSLRFELSENMVAAGGIRIRASSLAKALRVIAGMRGP